ncbi:FMN-binding protein [Pseudothermotoga sp. U03pept]|uniref:FMN-binding protein n=1 Tax=Pseudothermotoga sp. U03pept TaxID=3447012 RepID=UPI003F08916E
MKRFFKVLLIAFACIAGAIAIFFIIFNWGMNEVKKIQIKDISISQIADGEYLGEYKNGRWQYVVKVVVRDKRIEDIQILNQKSGFIDMNLYREVNESIISRVLKNQSLKVDVVTGATVTSKALLKAIETALER